MQTLNALLFKLTKRLKCRLIKLDGKPYMERYYVGQLFGVTFYLHRFVSADSERHIHNHPWRRSASLILTGSYLEEIATDLCAHAGPSGCVTEVRRVRWFNWIPGSRFHRISDTEPGTWSLFMHGAREMVDCGMAERPKGWGFLSTEYLVGTHQITAFKPYDGEVSDEEWYKHPDTPTGAQARRVGL